MEYEQYAPELFKLLTEIEDSSEGDTDVKVVTAMSAVVKLRSQKGFGPSASDLFYVAVQRYKSSGMPA